MGHDEDEDVHEHVHVHEHKHEDAHAHAHGHDHAHVLAEGAGRGKILFLDAPSGLAGDMILAALVDLGVPMSAIGEAVDVLRMPGFHIHVGHAHKSGIVATKIDVHVDREQPERTYGTIREMLERSELAEGIKARALKTFRKLGESEARVHRMPLDDVHFHEVGAVDAIVDVVGSAAALEWLGAMVIVSPLPMGRGFVKARHGILPLPAPAVVECLAGFDTYDAGIERELVTPTGAAIVAANASGSMRWPSMQPEATGFGAGTADFPDRPNVLRVVLGSQATAAKTDSHVVIEANLDDATGELVANAIETLLREGALDAWATPITMKKGRPAMTVSALAPIDRGDLLAAVMLRETTSLGVRRYAVSRVERPRRSVVVDTRYGQIPVKIAEGPFGAPQIKPEFDACQAAARAANVPVREVIAAALAAASKA